MRSLLETTVSGNATTGVTFTALNPVINSFTESYLGYPNVTYTGYDGEIVPDSNTVFAWSVNNATRYEIIGSSGIIYSGTANSWRVPAGTRIGVYALSFTFTLRAWNGSFYTDYSISVENQYETPGCDANCSGS